MDSLFIVSLPRTFSTGVYRYAGRALSLRMPSWVMDGEILNTDRYMHYQGKRFDESAKFTLPNRDPELVSHIHEYLAQTANPQGWIYKDVIQPFVMQTWQGLAQFRVLKIQRDVCDIAYTMLNRGWFYPQRAATRPKMIPSLLSAASAVVSFHHQARLFYFFRPRFRMTLVEGLVRAEEALARTDGVGVSFRDLMHDEQALYGALETLYPGVPLTRTHYITEAFVEKRERVAQRQTTPAYLKLSQEIERVRANLTMQNAI